MSRQVLTVPDIPPQFLTETEGNGLYALSAHNHDPVYVNVAGDTMTGTLTLTPSVSEQYGLDVRNDRARAQFQAATDTVFGRVGEEYAGSGMHLSNNLRTTAASGGWQRDDAAKLGAALAIGSGTTILNLSSSAAGSGNSPAALVNRLQVSPTGTLTVVPDAFTQDAIQANGAVNVLGPSVWVGPTGNNPGNGGNVRLRNDSGAQHWLVGMTTGAGARDFVVYDVARNSQVLSINATNGVLNVANINSTASLGITSASNIVFAASGAYIHPNTSNTMDLGHPSYAYRSLYAFNLSNSGNWVAISNHWSNPDNAAYCGYPAGPAQRWVLLAAVNGTIQTSHVEMKTGFAPLDPAACAQAVLDTDWCRFEYVAPGDPAPEPVAGDEDDEARGLRERRDAANRAFHARLARETVFARRQNGYVLGSAQHRTHDLFGLADRRSKNNGSDLAVVACALQDALKRIAQLEAART